MEGGEFSIVCGDGKLLKVPRDVLCENCDYFRAMFDSRMTESRHRSLDLRPAAQDLITRESAFRRRVLREIFLARQQGRGFLSKTVRKINSINDTSLGEAADDLLFAAGYFQARGWIDKLKANGRDSTMDVASAVHVLPYAEQCGLFEIHEHAEKAAVVHYHEFLKLSSGKQLDAAQLSAIKKKRLGTDCLCGGNFTVILQTDVCLDDQGDIRRTYALVDFRQRVQNDNNWTPNVVDKFSLRRNESIVQALTMRNYLFVVTSQYCWRIRKTRIRIYSFNPFEKRQVQKTDGAFTSMGSAWKLESDELTKQGYVQSFKVAQLTLVGKGCQVICVHSARRVSRRKGNLYKEMKDVDCYDPVDNKWRTCNKASFQKLSGSFDYTSSKTPHIVGPTQQADSHASASPPSDDTKGRIEISKPLYEDIDPPKADMTSLRAQCDDTESGQARFRFTIDKTLRSDGDMVTLRRVLEGADEVLYRISRDSFDVGKSDVVGSVENTLINSFIAVPRLFSLYYPDPI